MLNRIHFLLFVFYVCFANAQSNLLISGSVVDASTNEGLPFATVSIKKNLIGTITNELGNFEFRIPDAFIDDTLQITYIGYKNQTLSLKVIQSPLKIKLQQVDISLGEIVVNPQPPEFYIKQAILAIKNNYPKEPFQAQAYYREKVLENKNNIKLNEALFKTYCPNYLDTIKSQHQLLLFREEENPKVMAFMLKERQEAAEKEKKRIEKENEKNRKKGVTTEVKEKKQNEPGLNISSMFGGPETILKQGDITEETPAVLDTLKFKKFTYSFAKAASYNNSELMIINFKSKGKIEHVNSSGKIYIDIASYAIVKIETSGEFSIPVIIKPVLFLYGIGIEEPLFEGITEFQKIKDKWYPKSIQFNLKMDLINKHWFKPDEHSNIEIEGIYTVNKMQLDKISAIPVSKRFDAKKEMKTQVQNDNGVTWDAVNIIKR